MSEEETTSQSQDSNTVSDSEFSQIEEKIRNADSQKEKEIAERVKKELEMTRKLQELEDEKKKWEGNYTRQQEELDALKKEQEAHLKELVDKRLQEELAARKAQAQQTSESPFAKKDSQSRPDVRNMTPEQLQEIQAESRRQFEKAFAKRE